MPYFRPMHIIFLALSLLSKRLIGLNNICFQVSKSTTKYSFMINHQISADGFWERPILAPLMRAFPLAMQALKVANGKLAFPVQVNDPFYTTILDC